MTIAFFLDRDGTLNVEKGYIRNVQDLELIPGVAQAIRCLNEAGVLAILTTNQTGAARGFYDLTHIHALNDRLQELLKQEADAHLDAVYYCPHLEKGIVPEFAVDCQCRKPEPGMIQQALTRFPEIDLSRSYVLGDKASDVAFGKRAGCKSVLLKTGYGQRVLAGKYQSLPEPPEFVFEDMPQAVSSILGELGLLKAPANP
ncbi:D-glycero-alpha-D-manno-heptose-1,7-bisphosphate 7-phosphatase [Vampirovibrio chlorellavorus]|uniref:D-glycero-alpha-D-manno-heptose-1,7-bisphosphate 7-phosphatase n=1 Tax=Vampirovibrio chlorellavorus TaxID=758823 RepID=UPI0026F281F1|nr:HAD family hydrolase [Vampirovibrio chlorellavorus]